MKKFVLFIIVITSLITTGCQLGDGGLYITSTSIVNQTPTNTLEPTQVETADVTSTLRPTVTRQPTSLPTETPSPTIVQITPTMVPTLNPECSIPCGPNLFFNAGLDVRTDWNATRSDYEVPFVLYQPYTESPNILVPQSWGFEYLTGTNERNPDDQFCGQLSTPESGNALRDNLDWTYRVDGYDPNTNPEAFRWFKSWSCLNAGVTQSVPLLEGHRYVVGASVSTWATSDTFVTGNRSQLLTDTDKSNVEWAIRANFSNGPVFQGVLLSTYGFEDGIYDFQEIDGKFYYNGNIRTTFVTPVELDSNESVNVNFGFTASNMWPYGNTDYHIDNAFLYCLDCGYINPTPFPPDTAPTPTPIVRIYEPVNPTDVIVIADSLNIRLGAETSSPYSTNSDGTIKKVTKGDAFLILLIYENGSNGQVWAKISDTEWIAVLHPTCDKIAEDDFVGTCSIFEERS